MIFDLNKHREVLLYWFGLCCLLTWLMFNLWVLRDYFFPWWYSGGYTASGLSIKKLEEKKGELRRRERISNAFILPANITVLPQSTIDGSSVF